MAGTYYYWNCNQLYPNFLLKTLDGTIDISNVASIQCYWVVDTYQPKSTENLWSDVVTNLNNTDDYFGPFVQGSGGTTFDIGSTIEYATSVLVNTVDTDDDAQYWGTACYRMDIASVFQGAEVPALAVGSSGTYLRTLVFTITGTDDAEYLLGTISKDYEDYSSNTIEITPNGSDITVAWLDPYNDQAQVAPELGILFKLDSCECSKQYP